MSHQVEMVTLDQLIEKDHTYRKFKELWDLSGVGKELKKIEIKNDANSKGYGIFRLFLCLSGMINKVVITKASVIDSKGMKHVTPTSGAIHAHKGYCDKNAKEAAAKKKSSFSHNKKE
tara:strand:+ start:455 stop:808 length:354 start_codon:yes stop_codon:yes gene_type:complete